MLTASPQAASVNPAEAHRQRADGTWFTRQRITGPAVISYSISDGAGGTTTNSVTVNVEP
jgi:hypothetical protein